MNPLTGMLASVAFAALSATGGAWVGYQLCDGQHAKADLVAANRKVDVVAKQGAVNTAAATTQQAAHDRIVYVTNTITKEIPGALTPAIDARYPLSNGFVRLYNEGVRGVPTVPAPTAESDGAASGVNSSTFAAVANINTGAAQDCRAVLIGLQAWINDQSATFNTK